MPMFASPHVRALAATVAALCLVAVTAAPAAAHPWVARIKSSREFASARTGNVGFAVTNEQGRVIGGRSLHRTFPSASVVKSMLLVCYLQRRDVRTRALRPWERDLLGPMIRRSDDAAANRIWGLVSTSCLERLAKRSGMRRFSTNSTWGLTQITPYGTARLFYSIDRQVPIRHRPYAMTLLRTVVPAQRWGIATAVPPSFSIFFKGGFVGTVQNQGALLVRGDRRLALAVLTNGNPTWEYGQATQAGIARRLLRGYR